MAKEKPELKKSDLLAALKDKEGNNREGLTKDSLQAELAKSFAFIPEFFGYLFAMYENAGKFEVQKDGTLLVKDQGQIRTAPRTMYTLTATDTNVKCEKGTLMPGDKLPEGSSLSKASAAKAARKEAYAVYKRTLEQIDNWLEAEKTAEANAGDAKAA